MILDKNSGSVFSWSYISRHTSKRLALWSSEGKRGTNFAASRFMRSYSVKIRWHELHETPLNASYSSIVRRRSNVIASRIFLMFSSVLLVEGRPDRGWSSSDVTTFEARKPFVNQCLAQSFFFKSLSKHSDSFCCCFPQKEIKFDANTLFF